MDNRENGQEQDVDARIGIVPVALPHASEDAQKRLLELQLKMATSSINHEYARLQFDEINDRSEREDLLDYMHDCHRQYGEARVELMAYDPYALADFEADLMRQKQTTITHYHA